MKRLGAYSGSEGVSQKQNLAEIWNRHDLLREI